MDTRHLEDGRRAIFRHSRVLKRAKHDFFERKEAMMIVQSSMLSASALGASMRLDIKSAMEVVEKRRNRLLKAAFPYLEIDSAPPRKNDSDKYFDMLDRLKAEREKKKPSDGVGEEAPK